MTRFLICDTETSGLQRPPEPATGVVQVAYVELDENLEVIGEFNEMVNPGCPIEPGAAAVHGITDAMVEGRPTLGEVFSIEEPTLFIAHNVKFDFPRLSPYISNCVGTLCTLEGARRFLKGQQNNKLVTLIRHYKLPEFPAHDALGDVKMTVGLLKLLLEKTGYTLMQLQERLEAAQIPTEMLFGKHKGKKLADLPLSYINWLLDIENLNQGLRRGLEMQRLARGCKEF